MLLLKAWRYSRERYRIVKRPSRLRVFYVTASWELNGLMGSCGFEINARRGGGGVQPQHHLQFINCRATSSEKPISRYDAGCMKNDDGFFFSFPVEIEQFNDIFHLHLHAYMIFALSNYSTAVTIFIFITIQTTIYNERKIYK